MISMNMPMNVTNQGELKMKKISAGFNSCLQPMAKVIVSCRGKDGADNALAVAYCCNCSYDPPMVMVGIVPDRYSHHMIKETGCFCGESD